MVVINQAIPDEMLEQLSYLVTARFGLYFPRERWPDLENGLAKAIKELGYENVEVGAQALLNSNIGRTEIEILASHLTIGETYFYRDHDVFKAMEEEILPTLIARRANNGKYLRIWSAGCATGEEPYSIAIAISRVIPDLSQWNIRILATDINDTALRKAAEGIYGKWSFRGFPPEMQSRYFLPQPDGRFRVIPEIKRLVNFEYHNLAEDPYPALLNQTNAQDIIFCRNALMYFSRDKLGEVINRFYASLVGDGFLVVSPNDIPPDADSPFTQEMRGGVIYFSKNIHKNRTQILPSSNHPTDISFPEVEPFAAETIPDTHQSEKPKDIKSTVFMSQPAKETARSTSKSARDRISGHEKYRTAEQTALEQLKAKPNDSSILTALARTYANKGDLEAALGFCRQGITAAKTNATLYYIQATILLEMGLVDDAVRSLKQALFLNPGFLLAHFTLGNINHQRKQINTAKKHFENTITLLHSYKPEDIVPESEGMTVGRLTEYIQHTLSVEVS
jgi:chemotaxis protein methyltransferase CheR